MSHLFSNTNITIASTRFNNLESELSNSSVQLVQLSADINTFVQKMELSFTKEQFELTTLENTLLQLKYDILQAKHNDIIAQNKNLLERLEAYTCSICLTKAKDCILDPCGHFVGCMSCINMLPDNKCPICRSNCNYYVRIFNS